MCCLDLLCDFVFCKKTIEKDLPTLNMYIDQFAQYFTPYRHTQKHGRRTLVSLVLLPPAQTLGAQAQFRYS